MTYKRYYFRVKNSLKERGSVGYLNIIEDGEAIMITNRRNSKSHRTLLTMAEFEEVQDRFKLDVSEYIKEPENTVSVESIKSCNECYEQDNGCGGWATYQRRGQGDLPCFHWRPGDIVKKKGF